MGRDEEGPGDVERRPWVWVWSRAGGGWGPRRGAPGLSTSGDVARRRITGQGVTNVGHRDRRRRREKDNDGDTRHEGEGREISKGGSGSGGSGSAGRRSFVFVLAEDTVPLVGVWH